VLVPALRGAGLIAEWNPERQLWQTAQADLFSGDAEPFRDTWPVSGRTRAGKLLPLVEGSGV
jgi:hypothetical protein